jgi:hypothetical protein
LLSSAPQAVDGGPAPAKKFDIQKVRHGERFGYSASSRQKSTNAIDFWAPTVGMCAA